MDRNETKDGSQHSLHRASAGCNKMTGTPRVFSALASLEMRPVMLGWEPLRISPEDQGVERRSQMYAVKLDLRKG